MTESRSPAARSPLHRPLVLVPAALVIALLVAELPLVAAAVLLGSVVLRRPLLVRLGARSRGFAPRPEALGRATTATGLTLLVVGAAQAVGAAEFGLSVTTADGVLARTALALAVEAGLVLALLRYLKRRPA